MSSCARSAGPFLLALALAGCSDPAPKSPARRVILITCDTLRADRLGFGGNARPTSPNLDALSLESTVFENAWSAAPLTVPSLSSLLCGRFPDEIGAGPTNREVIPEEVQTIAEVAHEAGIATAAFVSNGVLRRPPVSEGRVGLQQGFDLYDDDMNAKEKNRDLLERTADACTDAVLGWLSLRDAKDPFFLWVHYQDPHGPYTPPAPLLAELERPAIEEPALPIGTNNSGLGQIPKYQRLDGLSTPRPYEDRYEAEIRYFDQQVGRLVAELRRRDMLDDALLVFTADHGESLGDHGYWFCHGESVHRELVHVPLFIRFPRASRESKSARGAASESTSAPGGARESKSVPGGALESTSAPQGGASDSASAPQGGARRVAGVVGHIDLWPTFVEALGLKAPANRGTSLFGSALPEGRVMLQFLGPIGNPNLRLGVTDGRWRAIVVQQKPPLLFDLATDPGETRDVAAAHPKVLTGLDARSLQFMQADARPHSRAVRPKLDPATQRGIEDLGYTDGDGH